MVSVIIPAYNREHIILKSVNSVLSQTYSDLELIVVDDGSSDGTRKILESINDERFRYIYQDNAGACKARNYGIELARGEYIAFHDSDDLWLPTKLEKQMNIFENYNADIVFCKLNYKRKNGTSELSPSYISEGFLNPIQNLFGIGTQTIIAKRKVFEKIRFDNELPRFQEFEMLYRASKLFSIYCLDDGLVDYEIGEDSISSNPEKLYQACNIIIKKHPEMRTQYPIMMKYMAHSLLSAANSKRGNKAEMMKYISFALDCSTSPKLFGKALLVRFNLYNLQRKIFGK